MKRLLLSIYLFALMAVCCLQTHAQIQDLYKMTTGELYSSFYVFDEEDELWGYFFLYDQGEVEKSVHEMKYVILDNELNVVATNTFEQGLMRYWKPDFSSVSKVGDYLFLNGVMKLYESKLNAWLPKVSIQREIQLSKNEVSEEFVVSKGQWKVNEDAPKDFKAEYRNPTSYMTIESAKYNGDLVHIASDVRRDGFSMSAESIAMYDKDHNKVWSTRLSKLNNYKPGLVSQLNVHDDCLTFILTTFKVRMSGMQNLSVKVVCLDLATGKSKFIYELENEKSKNAHDFGMKQMGEDIELIGFYSDDRDDGASNMSKRTGMFRKIIGSEGEVKLEKYLPWSGMSKKLDITKKGQMDGKYFVNLLSAETLKNGKTIIIAEKTIPQRYNVGMALLGVSSYTKRKTTDLLCFIFDPMFDLERVEVIEKAKSKGNFTDFIFSEKRGDDDSVDFFFSDFKEVEGSKGQWFLGINTYKDDKITTEEIPISSDDYVIVPLRAKEGYILLREYNVDDKYDKLRLEKLNR